MSARTINRWVQWPVMVLVIVYFIALTHLSGRTLIPNISEYYMTTTLNSYHEMSVIVDTSWQSIQDYSIAIKDAAIEFKDTVIDAVYVVADVLGPFIPFLLVATCSFIALYGWFARAMRGRIQAIYVEIARKRERLRLFLASFIAQILHNLFPQLGEDISGEFADEASLHLRLLSYKLPYFSKLGAVTAG
jgi:hypothetical protein